MKTKALMIAAVAFFAVVVDTVPAGAAWQYTRWGMTPAQVIKASQGAAKPTDSATRSDRTSSDGVALLSAPYRSGAFNFTAYFVFSGNALALVTIETTNGSSSALEAALRDKYGKPSENDNIPDANIVAEKWATGTDMIQFMATEANVSITYWPRENHDTKGL